MNIKNLKVFDMKKEEQTDEVKTELYKLTQQFVRKYWRDYYPQYQGDIDDIVVDLYAGFLTPKSRVKGKEESLLDKYDPKVTSLPYLVKVAVQRGLIDAARKDKGEQHYEEKFDEETGEVSLDYLVAHLDTEPDIQIEDIVFDEDDIAELRDLYDELPKSKQIQFKRSYGEVRNVIAPNFRALFDDLIRSKE